ncbi:LOW QUALITY PROTEIN: hypothetical protein BC938DRAFT_470882 [Jimgerdemannia flammicorona]|uniref:Uncharacterized protein n=1 Tax=Jimgerdemannia flammicorona TaxID=994334 RepID=A0A433Q9A8_9FUNG|nr:LOW QUALITY PROTEIN: hypothetical protein BC938DRAFT_470882 [Jimgerdemannia flammicorona]
MHLQFLQELKILVSNEDSLMDGASLEHYYNFWPQSYEGMSNDYYEKFYDFVMQNVDVFYTRSNRGQWINYQKAVFEDAELISSANKKEFSKIVSDFLIERNINVVQLPLSILTRLPKRQIVTPKLVRNNIRHATKAFVEKMEKDVFIAFFEYLLSDKDFAELRGCTILPLMDMSFGTFGAGENQFYIASEAEMALFPNLSSRFVNQRRISKSIIAKLKSEQATTVLNVKNFDHDVFVRLVSDKLLRGDRTDIDKWLGNIWDYVDADPSIDMAAFENIPILPTIGSTMLVSLNRKLPLLYEDRRQPDINAIMIKIGTHVIDKRYSNRLTDFVLDFSATNVLKCIHLASTNAKRSIKELLLPLSAIERDTLKTFLQRNDYDLFNSQSVRSSRSIDILCQLPIFRAFESSLNVVYKPAKECHLLPQDLPVFSVRSGMAILCNDYTDGNFAAKINIPELSVVDHVRDNVLPFLKNPLPGPKIDEYQKFLYSQLRREVATALQDVKTAPDHPKQ